MPPLPGGVISPVHDGYQKSSLIPAQHRLAMARLAVTRETEPEPWVRVSDWETKQVCISFCRLIVDRDKPINLLMGSV